jgi:hypothetical protein
MLSPSVPFLPNRAGRYLALLIKSVCLWMSWIFTLIIVRFVYIIADNIWGWLALELAPLALFIVLGLRIKAHRLVLGGVFNPTLSLLCRYLLVMMSQERVGTLLGIRQDTKSHATLVSSLPYLKGVRLEDLSGIVELVPLMNQLARGRKVLLRCWGYLVHNNQWRRAIWLWLLLSGQEPLESIYLLAVLKLRGLSIAAVWLIIRFDWT